MRSSLDISGNNLNATEQTRSSENYFNRTSATIAAIAMTGSILLTGGGNASAQDLNVPGTGGGIPGMAFDHGTDVPYPALTPVVDDLRQSVMQGAQNLNQRIQSAPGLDQINSFSQGTIVAREAVTKPAVAAKVNHMTLVGDPCNPDGILMKLSEARNITHMSCPVDNPVIPKTVIRDNQDPIAMAHMPTNLLDWANTIAAYEVAHPYKLAPESYNRYEHDSGNTHYVDLVMHETALKIALGRRGIHINQLQEQAIINAIPQAFRPQPVATPRSKPVVVPGTRKAASKPITLTHKNTPSSPTRHVPRIVNKQQAVNDPVHQAIDNTANAAKKAFPQYARQAQQVADFLQSLVPAHR